jgi:hypothetical protein
MVPIVPSLSNERRRSPSGRWTAGLAAACLALLASASPAQADSAWPVVLTVHDDDGAAHLEWALAPAGLGPAPGVEGWILTRWTEDGQATVIELPGTASSYVDTDVEAGQSYAYTVRYVEAGQQGPPSNPAVYSSLCTEFPFLWDCHPLSLQDDEGIPILVEDCLCIWP